MNLFLRHLFRVVVCSATACGTSTTNVGSVGPVSDASPVNDTDIPVAIDDASSLPPLPSPSDASADGGDAGSGATCGGACEAKACGRDECGHSCGACTSSPSSQAGCFMGTCVATCPGTPCGDVVDGHHVCEGGRGAGHRCAGGSLGMQVCTCTGGGWTDCGACL